MNNKLNEIESLTNKILFEIENIRGERDPMYNINVFYEDNLIKISWDSDVDKDLTFLYYNTEEDENGNPINTEWQHSSANYRRRPDSTSQLSDEIPIRLDGVWKIKAVVGDWIPEIENGETVGGKVQLEWDSDTFTVGKNVSTPFTPNIYDVDIKGQDAIIHFK